MKKVLVLSCLPWVLLLTFSIVFAHDEPETEETSLAALQAMTIKVLGVAAAISLCFVMLALYYQHRHRAKKQLFLAIVLPLIAASLFLAGATIYSNIISITKGPVHWHADYEVWMCDEKLDLIDPKGMSNRIGTSAFHEHGDDRIHIEGVVRDLDDISLGKYFKTIGGELSGTLLSYPTEQGLRQVKNGDLCNNQPATLKVFVNGKRIDHPEHHVIAPVAYVPPGDCIIIEFSSAETETTDKLCSSWKAKGWSYK